MTVECRSCHHPELAEVLDLGSTPLANRLLTQAQLGEPEPRYPLVLAFCPRCALVQITETVPPEVLFRDYLYFSSFSDTMVQHARVIADRLRVERGLGSDSLVVEVASNDGYLLQHYVAAGVPVLGIEPARNIAKVAEERGVRTVSEFFGLELAERLAADGHRADVIHANNVLAHVADLNGFVAGLAALLKPEGLAVIEAPYLKEMLDHVEFDTIYHEHLCYFSLTALAALFDRHGLRVVNVERLPIHGGSLRVHVVPAGSRERPAPTVAALLAEERAWGVDRLEAYQPFAERVTRLRADLVALLRDLKAQGRTLAAYGASAKGSTLLNYMGIDGALLDFVVDRSTVKQGRYTPGTHLPILPPEHLLAARPDDVLLLTWNFAEEIFRQQAAYLEAGGRFIVPVPSPTVVDAR